MKWTHWISFAWLCLAPASSLAVTPMIYAGYSSSVFLNSDGSVWGTGFVTDRWPGATSPVPILQLSNVIAVATHGGTDFALLADGTLWASGQNPYGQLGDGTTQYRSQPQPVPGLTGIKAVAAAGNHVLALKDDGTVWAWGANSAGQLGDGTQTDRYAPVQVLGLTNIINISAGPSGSIALRNDGTVLVWGNTCCGAAGNGLTPYAESDPEMRHLVPTQVHNLDKVIGIAAGESHYMALREDGTVWSWGIGANGENGTGSYSGESLPVAVPGLSNVVSIKAKGWRYSLALKRDGTVWAWGNNNAGQFGASDITQSATPIQVPGLADIMAIDAGWAHVLALRSDGTVFAWGVNGNAQLGDGSIQDRVRPLAVSGPGGSGQLNLLQPAPTAFNQLPQARIDLSADSGQAPLTVQATALDAFDPDGTVKSFFWKTSDGKQASGPSASFVFTQAGTYQIDLLIEDNAGGRGNDRREIVVAPKAAVAVSANPKVGVGQFSGIALANDGRILTWGRNDLLGFYDAQAENALPRLVTVPIANGISGAIDIGVSGSHAHVLLADGTVLGWGANDFGEIGVGSSIAGITQPQLLSNLPPVQALAAGYLHNLALTRDGRVFAWGNNTEGQLGVGDSNSRFQATEVPGLAGVTGIAASPGSSVALMADGTVWAWGDNASYQLGDGTRISRNRPIQIPGLSNVTKVFATRSNIFAQKSDGTVWITGDLPSTVSVDPGPMPGPRRVPAYDGVTQIAGDWNFIIALKADGTVWSGGKQNSLVLGIQIGGDIAGLAQIPGISDAIWVAAENNAAVILRRDGTVLSWGINNFGQLGDGTLAQRATPVAVINESANGYLDLISGSGIELPPSMSVPFFAVASGSVAEAKASVNTITKFNTADVGKTGSVFVTAAVPPGSLIPVQSSLTGSGTSSARAISSADTAASSFVLIQLTALSGWQPVINGQLLPYASGVLGDQLAAQTILSGTDTANLKGAGFCLGYGTSAEEMASSERMRMVATIPDPNATGASLPNCVIGTSTTAITTTTTTTSTSTSTTTTTSTSTSTTTTTTIAATTTTTSTTTIASTTTTTQSPGSSGVTLNFAQGWNLVGNGSDAPIDVVATFSDTNAFLTVWKWVAAQSAWAFHAPSLAAQGGTVAADYAASKGYQPLTSIAGGDGFWVNAKQSGSVRLTTGNTVSIAALAPKLAAGWNLVSIGETVTAKQFCDANSGGITTLWAWDTTNSAWYFYAPSLDASGNLNTYIAGKGYLDFTANGKALGPGVGFWVNKPNPVSIPFSAIVSGTISGISTAQNLVVRDASSWAALWAAHAGPYVPAPQLPSIDFGAQMVLGVFLGARSNGCYSVQIQSVAQTGGKISVEYKETVPAADAVCAQVIAQPFQLVAIPASSDTVVFTRTVQ